MSILGRRVSKKVVAAMAVLFVAVVGLLPAMTLPLENAARAREVTLVARDMAFYFENDLKTANPVIEARPGETIRVVLANRDRGMTHDFAVPASEAAIDALDWNEEAAVTFNVPDEPGTYEYVCRPHLLMMRGRLIVRSGD
jgi:plastocyanin